MAWSGDPGPVVMQRGEHFPDARFFPDAQLSVAENLLRRREGVDPEAAALVAVDETGTRVSRSWDEFRADTAAMASALRDLGVQPGDRVVTWLPNTLEAVIVMLGATAIGAVYSSTSPDFGARGVLDRFGQIEPVVLFAADSYCYGGKRFDCLERLDEIRSGLPTVRATVVVGDAPEGTVAWDDFVGPHRGARSHLSLRVRPPVVRTLLVGHHRRPEVHRPPRRWGAAPAPQGAPAPLRHPRQ